MKHFKYLIIGGGMTADAAVRGIRSVDPTSEMGLISTESDAPYNRPPLSKALWKGEPLDTVWRKTQEQSLTLQLGRTVNAINMDAKQVSDNEGITYSWEKLLLATGGSPRKLPFGGENIIYFRTLADYRRLRALAEKKQRFAVIGGGFIGSEIAAALALNKKEVVMLFPGKFIGEHIFPRDLSRFVSDVFRQKGVEIADSEQVSDLETRGEKLVVKTNSRREFVVDGVVAGLGILPNVQLAEAAGLKVENGIVVDEFLRTSQQDVYAAGDVAAFLNPVLGKRMRIEHEDNANTMGKVAGLNMAGKAEPYHHLPSFYSDLFELGYEAVGELDSRLETIADWKEPNHEGVIYYLKDGRVRGVLLWNVWGQVDAARALIAEPGPFTAASLMGRLPAKTADAKT